MNWRPEPRRRIARWIGLILAVATMVAARPARAEKWNLWSGFGRGSYQLTKQTSETFDETGRRVSTSVTMTKTTLVECTERRIVLRVETTMELAGKKFESPPAMITQGRYGEYEGEQVHVDALPDEPIVIGGQKFLCRPQRIEIAGGETKKIVQLASHAEVAPHELRRVVTVLDDRGEPISTTTSEVLAANVLPQGSLSAVTQAVLVRTTHRNAKLTTSSLAVQSPDVPGYLLSSMTTELDTQGRVMRRNTTELVGYEARPDDSRSLSSRAKTRREERRQRRQP